PFHVSTLAPSIGTRSFERRMLPVVDTGAFTRADGAGAIAGAPVAGRAADIVGVVLFDPDVAVAPDGAFASAAADGSSAGSGGPWVRKYPSTMTPARKLPRIATSGHTRARRARRRRVIGIARACPASPAPRRAPRPSWSAARTRATRCGRCC